ncbi:hypothetical protein LCGC14_1531130 [marine sediment metagenome]|uniref:Uncharacterized protein n=1 Tax=marine sediment metagenome TaxID=412755 RepID=A0A0F9LWQ3_9ZZZZ
MWDNDGFAHPNNWWGVFYIFVAFVFFAALISSFFRNDEE